MNLIFVKRNTCAITAQSFKPLIGTVSCTAPMQTIEGDSTLFTGQLTGGQINAAQDAVLEAGASITLPIIGALSGGEDDKHFLGIVDNIINDINLVLKSPVQEKVGVSAQPYFAVCDRPSSVKVIPAVIAGGAIIYDPQTGQSITVTTPTTLQSGVYMVYPIDGDATVELHYD